MIVKELKKLREKSKNTTPEECKEKNIFKRLEEELATCETVGIGLAAIQIGEPIKASIIRLDDLKLNLINPEIVDGSKPILFRGEGCLSFPGKSINTVRYNKIKLKWLDEEGKENEREFEELPAIAFQHEIDHHNGYVMFDREARMTVKRTGRKIGRNEKCKKCDVKFKRHEGQNHEFAIK